MPHGLLDTGISATGLGLRTSPEVMVTSPAPADEWQRVWESAPGALPSQTPAWQLCVRAVDGWEDASRLYRTADGRRLVLPLVRRRLLGGSVTMEESLPNGWGPGGLLGEHGEVRPEDVAMVVADLARGRAQRIQIRPDPTTEATWRAGVPSSLPRSVRTVPRMFSTVPLTGGFDAVWRTRFRGEARHRVRKAERAGVVIERDDTGRLVPVFQCLYALSVDRWARADGLSLAAARRRADRREPRRKLATVAAGMGPACRVYVASVDEQPVAATVVLWGATTAAYWRGAMNIDLARHTYANYLLHRTAIKDAADDGHLAYHMGDSAPGSSLAHFKSRFGAVEHHYAAYRIERRALTGLVGVRRGARRILALRPGG